MRPAQGCSLCSYTNVFGEAKGNAVVCQISGAERGGGVCLRHVEPLNRVTGSEELCSLHSVH